MSELRPCPGRKQLCDYLDLRLPHLEERSLRGHIESCADCAAAAIEIEPTAIFSRLPHHTLAASEWAEVMGAVREEVARGRSGLFPLPVWFSPRFAAAAGLLLLALALVSRSPAPAALVEAGSGGADKFIYLSNPDAEVTHVVFRDADGGSSLVTMVVDAALDDAF